MALMRLGKLSGLKILGGITIDSLTHESLVWLEQKCFSLHVDIQISSKTITENIKAPSAGLVLQVKFTC